MNFLKFFPLVFTIRGQIEPGNYLLKTCRLCEQVVKWPKVFIDKNIISKCGFHLKHCRGLLHRSDGLASSEDFNPDPTSRDNLDQEIESSEKFPVKIVAIGATLTVLLALILGLIMVGKPGFRISPKN